MWTPVEGAAGVIAASLLGGGGGGYCGSLWAVHMATRPSNLVTWESWEAGLSDQPATQAWCMKKLGR